MASRAVALVAGIIDRLEDRPYRTGRPPLPTIEVVETLRFFVREGVQWRELRAAAGRACGSTLRRRLDDWSATALLRHREVNAQYTDDAILLLPTANIGIAVAAPQGLVVPVIHNAERLRLTEIAAARADIVSRAREGKLARDDLENGTFTISNLGMYRVERFTAVLNPPQAAIVAIGATEERAVALDGEVVVRPTMTITGTFDHRAVDGTPVADLLQTVKEPLEEPALML